jgi:hypothetical protein
MSDEAKAAMKAKRAATIAAKKAAPEPAPAPAPPAEEPKSDDDKKPRKPRAPMSDEAKAAMKLKREATIACAIGAVHARCDELNAAEDGRLGANSAGNIRVREVDVASNIA